MFTTFRTAVARFATNPSLFRLVAFGLALTAIINGPIIGGGGV